MHKIFRIDNILLAFIVSGFFLGAVQGPIDSVVLTFKFPHVVHQILYFIYFASLMILILIGLTQLSSVLKISRAHLLFVLPSFLVLMWSIFAGDWIARFLIIFLATLTVPIVLSKFLWKEKNAKRFVFVVLIVLLLNLLFSLANINPSFRSYGIYANPNLMAIVSILALISVFAWQDETKNFGVLSFLFLILVCILVLLSGSRASGFFLICVLGLYFFRIFGKKTVLFIGFFCLIFLAFLPFEIINALEIRSFEFKGSTSDSGRSAIWDRAFACLSNFRFSGMGNEESLACIDIPNAHNSYLRVALFGGVFLSILYFGLLFSAILYIIFFKKVNPFIKLFFVLFPLVLFGEDYVVDLGSPFFFLYLIILSLLAWLLADKKLDRN